MSKTLEDRLIRLEIPLPAALVPRVLSAAASKRSPVARRRLRLTVTLAMMLLVGAFVASLYAAPRFADALAGAPVIGGPTAALLRSVGLAPYAKQFTTINEVAVSSGYQVELVAAYADATQTILIFRSSPQADVFPGIQWPSSLTDQFGATLARRPAGSAAHRTHRRAPTGSNHANLCAWKLDTPRDRLGRAGHQHQATAE